MFFPRWNWSFPASGVNAGSTGAARGTCAAKGPETIRKSASARFKMREDWSVSGGLPSESLRGFRALGGEGNVPDSGFLAGVDDLDDALVSDVAIAADPDRLVLELLGDGRKLFKQLLPVHHLGLHLDTAVDQHVDDDFPAHPLGLGTFLGRRNLDIQF